VGANSAAVTQFPQLTPLSALAETKSGRSSPSALLLFEFHLVSPFLPFRGAKIFGKIKIPLDRRAGGGETSLLSSCETPAKRPARIGIPREYRIPEVGAGLAPSAPPSCNFVSLFRDAPCGTRYLATLFPSHVLHFLLRYAIHEFRENSEKPDASILLVSQNAP